MFLHVDLLCSDFDCDVRFPPVSPCFHAYFDRDVRVFMQIGVCVSLNLSEGFEYYIISYFSGII